MFSRNAFEMRIFNVKISNRSKMVSRVLKGIGASKIDIFLASIVRSIQKEAKSGEDYHKISI